MSELRNTSNLIFQNNGHSQILSNQSLLPGISFKNTNPRKKKSKDKLDFQTLSHQTNSSINFVLKSESGSNTQKKEKNQNTMTNSSRFSQKSFKKYTYKVLGKAEADSNLLDPLKNDSSKLVLQTIKELDDDKGGYFEEVENGKGGETEEKINKEELKTKFTKYNNNLLTHEGYFEDTLKEYTDVLIRYYSRYNVNFSLEIIEKMAQELKLIESYKKKVEQDKEAYLALLKEKENLINTINNQSMVSENLPGEQELKYELQQIINRFTEKTEKYQALMSEIKACLEKTPDNEGGFQEQVNREESQENEKKEEE